MAARTRGARRRHGNDAADPIESAAIDSGAVAGNATAGDPSVAHLRPGKGHETTCRALMTGITAQPRGIGHVAGRHADGAGPIVARGACDIAGHHALVVKIADLRERYGVVTGVTVQRGLDMVGRLSQGVHAVMAGLAGRIRDRAVVKKNTGKTRQRSRMAGVTTGIHGNVGDRLGDCTTWIVLHVASCAVLGRALEHTIEMAGFAAHHLVRAFQGKAGCHMVKLNVAGLRQCHL